MLKETDNPVDFIEATFANLGMDFGKRWLKWGFDFETQVTSGHFYLLGDISGGKAEFQSPRRLSFSLNPP